MNAHPTGGGAMRTWCAGSGMAGLADLPALLVQMEPVLADAPYGFGVADAVPPGLQPFALIHEAEGITVLAEVAVLAAAGSSNV